MYHRMEEKHSMEEQILQSEYYCIIVTGMPAAGKSTLAEAMSKKLKLPLISKDGIKERLFDNIGFQSRAEKVNLGIASMEILYYMAGQLMKAGQAFILENNFEHSSEPDMRALLEKYRYAALTITLTGDYRVIYQRFLERESSPDRHRGHVVNDCYPEKKEGNAEERKVTSASYESFARGIERRGFDVFSVGSRIQVDTTDFSQVDEEELFSQIAAWREGILHDMNVGSVDRGLKGCYNNIGS